MGRFDARYIAFLETITTLRPALHRYCARMTGSLTDGEDVVLYDNLGAGTGQQIGVTEGTEAFAPFHPERKPIDAYCSLLIDQLVIR